MADEATASERPADPATVPGRRSGPVTCSAAESRRALEALAHQLGHRQLHTSLINDSLLLVLNPAVCSAASTSIGAPGLQQLVASRPLNTGAALWFWWVWSVADDLTPTEFGPLCPATEIKRAAERIAHVLATHSATPTIDL